MGKAARLACVFLPMVLTIGSFISLGIVFLAGSSKSNSTLQNLYYFRSNTSHIKAALTSNPAINNVVDNFLGDVPTGKLYDWYTVYMFNYCAGNTTNGVDKVAYCSPRKANFVFNPIQMWDLNNTLIEKEIPKAVNSAVNAYTKTVHFLFIVNVISIVATAVSIIIGVFAICSRIGSCVTTIFVATSTLFTFLAALISTVLYSILVGGLNTGLKPYSIKSQVGTSMMALEWIAVAFSIGALLFWIVSICCVSGKSNKRQKMTPSGYGPFAGNAGYQPVESPHPYQQAYRGTELHDYGEQHGTTAGPYKGRDTAYEPFRHQNV